jgi:hypothetical protein
MESTIAKCPHCGAEVATGLPEIQHMYAQHLEVIIERFRKSGMHEEAQEAQDVLDRRAEKRNDARVYIVAKVLWPHCPITRPEHEVSGCVNVDSWLA